MTPPTQKAGDIESTIASFFDLMEIQKILFGESRFLLKGIALN